MTKQPSNNPPARHRRFLTAAGIVLLVFIGVITAAALFSPEDELLPFDYEGFD